MAPANKLIWLVSPKIRLKNQVAKNSSGSAPSGMRAFNGSGSFMLRHEGVVNSSGSNPPWLESSDTSLTIVWPTVIG